MIRPRPLLALAALFLATTLPAAVLRVPAQYATIGGALSAAKQGDLVLVAPGTYKESLAWPSVDGIRLVAESGPAATTIDAGGTGRVINFGTGLTRATLLQGFTVTGGLLRTSRNYGCGIYVGSSPTLRGNQIVKNRGDGTSYNHGGGLYIYGSGKPLIENNLIAENTLRNGSWNYGAGIYVGSSAAPTIVGNTIQGNVNELGHRGYGGGIYTASGSPVTIAGNVIAGNVCKSTLWNYGAGIHVYSGTAHIVNNTIVGNTVSGGSWTDGGGIHFNGSSGRIHNNIVTGNTAKKGGGINYIASTLVIPIDYNNVWQNSGGDYAGCTAGKNSISADPRFATPTNYHLLNNSPCLDRGHNAHVPKEISRDFEGDPRLQDGNLDGKTGNGATVDMGADEVSNVRLITQTTPVMGKPFLFDVSGLAGGYGLLLVGLSEGNAFADPYGVFLLGPDYFILARGALPIKAGFFVVPLPQLTGFTIYAQAIVVQFGATIVGNTSNRLDILLR